MTTFHAARRSEMRAKHLRRAGFIPVGLVERSHITLPLQITVEEFREIAHQGAHTQVEISIEGEKQPRKALVKEVSVDPLGREVMHITFQEVSPDDRVKMDVPIVGTGENEDAKAGGVTLTQVLDSLKVRGKVSDLPERVEVDISGITAGGTLTVADLSLPEGIEALTAPETVVFSNTIDAAPDLGDTPTEEPTEEAEAAESDA